MELHIKVTAEVSDNGVRESIVTILEEMLPYMCDNVIVYSYVQE